MTDAHITYTSRHEATPEAELDALAAIYSLSLQKQRETQEVVEPAREPNDRNGAEIKKDSAYARIIPRDP